MKTKELLWRLKVGFSWQWRLAVVKDFFAVPWGIVKDNFGEFLAFLIGVIGVVLSPITFLYTFSIGTIILCFRSPIERLQKAEEILKKKGGL
jgi:hypothetical protein